MTRLQPQYVRLAHTFVVGGACGSHVGVDMPELANAERKTWISAPDRT